MSCADEQSGDVLDAAAMAHEAKRVALLGGQHMDHKEFDTLRARFARRGYVLQRVYRAGDARPTYHATRWAQTRVYSQPHDLASFLSVVEGLPV